MSLKTDYKDAMFQGSRKYQMIQNDDGTVSFEDVTEYTQEGDSFGAKDINETNTEVEKKFDSSDVVDPMVTTQTGFAADAKKTREAIEEIEQSFQDGCDVIVSGCTSYGSTPASNSPADIVSSIGDIYNNRYNSGYNSGRTQGRNDVKNNPTAYGLYVPPKTLTGSYTIGAGNNESEGLVNRQINFSTPFASTPKVTVSCTHNRGVAKVVSVNRTTLVIGTAKSYGDIISSMTVNWTAYTD